jgi:hypothetical protein
MDGLLSILGFSDCSGVVYFLGSEPHSPCTMAGAMWALALFGAATIGFGLWLGRRA